MHLFRIPSWLQSIYPGVVWHGNREGRQVYLTFDDGPVPGITDFVLEELTKRGMGATFFMVGENVSRHPELAREVVASGHAVGNHTYHHLNGRNTTFDAYMLDVALCQAEISQCLGIVPTMFRPPYGRMKAKQRHALRSMYRVVLWEILAGDYVERLPAALISKEIQAKTRPGSIVLFHDQQKTAAKIKKVLPDFLAFLDGEGFHATSLSL
ncbi:MAG: polysaccharide deacetylase family protein [Lunatimonas sp.]|uniref:polysaccharide deacetylase family protein n=1 Tax=Lunatimonas sp. TaxID=2060141 RepID=UPI00263B3ADC|nr:polysaccharide deacetylase family protein [Lunatimonas sp.]MCC5936394.1 polysaccharide deacetylase family protein [Lunatimonas sp.]